MPGKGQRRGDKKTGSHDSSDPKEECGRSTKQAMHTSQGHEPELSHQGSHGEDPEVKDILLDLSSQTQVTEAYIASLQETEWVN